MHTVQPLPKCAHAWYGSQDFREKESICALHHLSQTDDVSPCSHFDHCERPAVIWLYLPDCSPAIYGFCNLCYAWCYPAPGCWYRMVGISQDFTGRL
jgi:hypothetical protein